MILHNPYWPEGRNWRDATCVSIWLINLPTWSGHFRKGGKSQAPACSLSDKGLSLRLKLLWCFNQNQWTFAVRMTHHKSFPKICVIPAADSNNDLNKLCINSKYGNINSPIWCPLSFCCSINQLERLCEATTCMKFTRQTLSYDLLTTSINWLHNLLIILRFSKTFFGRSDKQVTDYVICLSHLFNLMSHKQKKNFH